MTKRVQLIISDLLLPDAYQRELCADLDLPILRRLLARSTGQTLPAQPLETLLCQLFGLKQTPLAALGAPQDLVSWPDHTQCLRADPVYLRLQRDKLILQPSSALTRDEAQALIISLNQHFEAQGLSFVAPHPQRWYLLQQQPKVIQSVLWSQAVGHNINALLPKGSDALWWHQLLNEIQMLLFNHPVNQQREEVGQLPVNSLWFWGEGELATPTCPYATVSADSELPQWLAQAAACEFVPWASQWQATNGPQLLVWTGLSEMMLQGDFLAWQQSLLAFEQNYLAPLWQALKQGRLQSLELCFVGADFLQQRSLGRWDCYRFWSNSSNLL